MINFDKYFCNNGDLILRFFCLVSCLIPPIGGYTATKPNNNSTKAFAN